MAMISFAQNAEDVLLRRVLPQAAGFYVDIGANDPTFHSVTRHFYDHGWCGVNVEPMPEMFARLRRERPRDINLNLGVSDRESVLTFYDCPQRNGWATFSPELAERYRRDGLEVVASSIPVATLARVFEQHVGDRTVDFLKIDVEGLEAEVLRGADFERWRPRVVVIEYPKDQTWEPLILEAGYLRAARDGLNGYYVRREEPGLLAAFELPVNVHDDYIPHGYQQHIEALTAQAAESQAQAAESQAQAAESRAQAAELRGHWEASLAELEARAAQIEELRGHLESCRAELEALKLMVGDLGPSALELARRLKRLGAACPPVAGMVRRAGRLAG